jgi:hypothetical protein
MGSFQEAGENFPGGGGLCGGLIISFFPARQRTYPMKKFLIPLLAVVVVSVGTARAQKVDLQGTIRDRYTSAPLSQAKVTLLGPGLEATTDSAGRFHILQVPSGVQGGILGMPLRAMGGRSLAFHFDRPGDACLVLLDPSGKEMLRNRFSLQEAGDWEIEVGAVPAGLYFAQLAGPSFSHAAKVVLLAGGPDRPRAPVLRRLPGSRSLAKAAAATDSLRVTKAGYRPSVFPLADLEQMALALVLSDTTVSMGRLSSLGVSIGAFQPAFQSAVSAYKLVLPDSVTSIRIIPDGSPASPFIRVNGALVASGAHSNPFALSIGANVLNISVASRDSSATSSYTLEVQRVFIDSAALASLTLSAGTLTPAFNPNVLAYTASIPNAVSSITVRTQPSQPHTQVMLGESLLQSGINSSPVAVDPAPKTLTLRALTTTPGKVAERRYTIALTRPDDMPPQNGPKLLPTPTVIGPDFTPAGFRATYTVSYVPIANCGGAWNYRYTFSFGDGTTEISKSIYPAAHTISHTWSTPGTSLLTVQLSCLTNQDSLVAQSDWTDTLRVTVFPESGSGLPMRLVSGYRPASETWHPETTYVVTAHARFDSSALLTILPGTRVTFLSDTTYLSVGKISAVGTPVDSIHFDVGQLRVQWKGNGTTTFNPDGSYRTGPRFEYCNFSNGRLYVDYNIDTYGGSGFYLKNSNVWVIQGGSWGNAVGTYIEHCRIGNLFSLRLYLSRILNSYFGGLTVITDRPYSLEIHRCDITTLSIPFYEFDKANITGNTLRSFTCKSYVGTLSGNNFLPTDATELAIGTTDINMQGNYWGPTVTAEMEAKGSNQNIGIIKDIFDDVSLGKVDYSGWKSAPIPDAQPDW